MDNLNDIQLVVLMGGKATRLAPLNYSLPKGMLSVNQKPVIFNVISPLIEKGLKNITFIASPSNYDILKKLCR